MVHFLKPWHLKTNIKRIHHSLCILTLSWNYFRTFSISVYYEIMSCCQRTSKIWIYWCLDKTAPFSSLFINHVEIIWQSNRSLSLQSACWKLLSVVHGQLSKFFHFSSIYRMLQYEISNSLSLLLLNLSDNAT